MATTGMSTALRRCRAAASRSSSSAAACFSTLRASSADPLFGKKQAHGPGMHHSGTNLKIALFGATGFLGRYVTYELGKVGNELHIATRGDDYEWRHLKLCADYGKIVGHYMSFSDEDSVRKALRGADVVVNMVGKHYETKHYLPWIINQTLHDSNVKSAEIVAAYPARRVYGTSSTYLRSRLTPTLRRSGLD